MPIDKIQQEEMNKRFDEKFPGVSCECGDRDIFDFEPVKSFLQSEINLAVANKEKEMLNNMMIILGKLEQTKTYVRNTTSGTKR